MENLTHRQQEIIEFIVQYTFEHLYQPTFKEIAKKCSIQSTNGVNDHLKALRRKGYLGPSTGSQRGMELTDRALHLVKMTDKVRAKPIIRGQLEVPSY